MKIDGKALAGDILVSLQKRVENLKAKGVTPHMVVILVGDDPSSKSYINQKQLKSQHIGAKITILTYPITTSQDELLLKILELNDDASVHGIIVQRPLPYHIDDHMIDDAVVKEKDIDGFRSDSPYDPPVAEAVYSLIVYAHEHIAPQVPLFPWPTDIKVVLLGKGRTAGNPVHKLFEKLGIAHDVIDTKTPNPEVLIKRADIIVSAVGKRDVITSDMVKNGVILIDIGMHMEERRLRGDYDDESLARVASFYTPTPGGVGPINVAMLLKNLVEAAEKI